MTTTNKFTEETLNIPLPKERINEQIYKLLKSEETIIDAHCHIFDKTCVPLPYIMQRKPKFAFIIQFIQNLLDIKFTDIDDFIKLLTYSSMKPILDHYKKYEISENMVLLPLMVDLQFGWKNDFPKHIPAQISELKLLMNDYNILPFLAIDPRQTESSPSMFENFINAFTGKNPFAGIKVYPSMGFLPSDPRLIPIYEICVKKKIPITTHCGENAVNTFDKNITVTGTKKEGNKLVQYTRKLNGGYFETGEDLTHPKHWEEVLDIFPELTVNLAHFGGHSQWKKYSTKTTPEKIKTIENLIKTKPNVYTDFSYNISNKKACKNLKLYIEKNPYIIKRLLFGTDYHLVLVSGRLQKSISRFKTITGENWKYISRLNTCNFLGINI